MSGAAIIAIWAAFLLGAAAWLLRRRLAWSKLLRRLAMGAALLALALFLLWGFFCR